MNKNVAIVICNYNKQEYVLKCIESVLNSTYKNYDIYVVDNASTDDSVVCIKKQFSDKVKLIINKENKGGSGGFNTGIKYVLGKEYEYVYLLDNDVIVDEKALECLVDYLDANQDVGVAGSKIFFMDNPNIVQEFGSFIDFDTFNMRLEERGKEEFIRKNTIVNCDYVPACSALIRMKVIEKIGTFNEQYFVYWDDIDFGHRVRLNGYRVVANSNSIVWHKGGGTVRSNTFGTYYFWRNRTNFFIKYCEESQIEKFIGILFDETIKSIYSCNYTGKYSSAKTILLAINDAIDEIGGKAPDGRIFPIENIENKNIRDIVNNKKQIGIICNENFKIINDIINRINEENNVIIISNEENKIETSNKNIIFTTDVKYVDKCDLKISVCSHILDIKNIQDDYVSVCDTHLRAHETKA
ncbi:glycosyltransferase family 2 protein, partial [Clostridium saccharoperbutylacetonicum]|uniref:glycosyltransferase family 2 protein n=1 Tax=Clostridium saccharoperbutylacetonicum TaxID=36745 RepID=UPI0039E85603